MIVALTFASMLLFAEPGPASPGQLHQTLLGFHDRSFPTEKQQAEAIEALTALKNLYPTSPEALHWQAYIAADEGKAAEAKALYEQLLAQTDAAPALKAAAARELGYQALEARDPATAETWAQKAIAWQPADPRGYALLADVAHRTGSINPVLAKLATAAASYPELTPLYLETLADVGLWDRLRQEIEQVLSGKISPAVRHHFQARLANLDGDQWRAFLLHFLAAEGGNPRDSAVAASRYVLQRYMQTSDADLKPPFDSYVIAYSLFERPSEAESAMEYLAKVPPSTDLEKLVHGHLHAGALMVTPNYAQAEPILKAMLAIDPAYVPALIYHAELLEAGRANAEAAALVARAKQAVPEHPFVLRRTRMGANFLLNAAGEVVAESVSPNTPWHDFSLRAGDVILALDERPLAKETPVQRLRLAREYQGGRVTYRTADGTVLSDDLDLVLFDDF